jgi:hypothetical protein
MKPYWKQIGLEIRSVDLSRFLRQPVGLHP